MAFLHRTELGVKEFGSAVTIPNDPKARLMYYLDSMCVVLDLSRQGNLSRLRDFRQYNSLTEAETDTLVTLCFMLSPDELSGKVIFQDDSMCGDSNNTFFEVSAVRHNLLLTESIMIGGQQTKVTKIMAYKQQWLLTNWVNPMKVFTPRLARIASGALGAASPSRPAITYSQPTPASSASAGGSSDCCCTIL